MNRDDIPVGVGGDGGILDDGTILPHVGGYLPLIEQVHLQGSYSYILSASAKPGANRRQISGNVDGRRLPLSTSDSGRWSWKIRCQH